MAIPRPYDPPYHKLPSLDHAGNAINTLFVSGLPDDVNAREISNLLGHRPGFDYCEITNNDSGNQVVAVADFVNHSSAMAALHALNGLKFDPQTDSTLHVELARSNYKRKDKPGHGANVVIDKRSAATTKDGCKSSDAGDSETEEPSELNKDTSAESDDDTHVDPENTGAAETMPPSMTDFFYDLLLNDKLNHTNFVDWYRRLRITLRAMKKLYILESPIPDEPPVTAAKASRDAWIKHTDDSTHVACLMLASMIPDFQKVFEDVGAYEMLNQLKQMFDGQIRHEHVDMIKAFIGCKMTEESQVSSHVLKMKSYIEKLKRLGSPLSNEMATYLILNSLPKSYDEFVQNFYLNNREVSISDLQMMLKIAEKNIKGKQSGVLNVRDGRVMKPRAKAKGVPQKQVSKTKERPAKDDTCFHCGEVGHWLRNCPTYLEELQERKAWEGL